MAKFSIYEPTSGVSNKISTGVQAKVSFYRNLREMLYRAGGD